MTSKYRVNDLVKYHYSDIGEFIGEGYTTKALRNDELVKILNSQEERIKELEEKLEDCKTLHFRKTIKWRSY